MTSAEMDFERERWKKDQRSQALHTAAQLLAPQASVSSMVEPPTADKVVAYAGELDKFLAGT